MVVDAEIISGAAEPAGGEPCDGEAWEGSGAKQELGRVWGDWKELGRELGEGGRGRLWRCRVKEAGRKRWYSV